MSHDQGPDANIGTNSFAIAEGKRPREGGSTSTSSVTEAERFTSLKPDKYGGGGEQKHTATNNHFSYRNPTGTVAPRWQQNYQPQQQQYGSYGPSYGGTALFRAPTEASGKVFTPPPPPRYDTYDVLVLFGGKEHDSLVTFGNICKRWYRRTLEFIVAVDAAKKGKVGGTNSLTAVVVAGLQSGADMGAVVRVDTSTPPPNPILCSDALSYADWAKDAERWWDRAIAPYLVMGGNGHYSAGANTAGATNQAVELEEDAAAAAKNHSGGNSSVDAYGGVLKGSSGAIISAPNSGTSNYTNSSNGTTTASTTTKTTTTATSTLSSAAAPFSLAGANSSAAPSSGASLLPNPTKATSSPDPATTIIATAGGDTATTKTILTPATLAAAALTPEQLQLQQQQAYAAMGMGMPMGGMPMAMNPIGMGMPMGMGGMMMMPQPMMMMPQPMVMMHPQMGMMPAAMAGGQPMMMMMDPSTMGMGMPMMYGGQGGMMGMPMGMGGMSMIPVMTSPPTSGAAQQ